METKKWYTSKTIWGGILSVTTALITLLVSCGVLTADLGVKICGFLGTVGGAVGIYARNNSDGTKIG
jgi:hypothetical protein